MTPRRRRLFNQRSPRAYLFYDSFSGGTVTHGQVRTADVGTWQVVVDTIGRFVVSGGVLGTAGGLGGDPSMWSTAFTRRSGLGYFITCTKPSSAGNLRVGWTSTQAATNNAVIFQIQSNILIGRNAQVTPSDVGTPTPGAAIDYGVVLRPNGGFYLGRGGNLGSGTRYTLL
jgi:hypothetical protein